MNKLLLIFIMGIFMMMGMASAVLYDDFNDASFNISKWRTQNFTTGGGSVSFSESGGTLNFGTETPSFSQQARINVTSLTGMNYNLNWSISNMPTTSFGGADKWVWCGVKVGGTEIIGLNRTTGDTDGNYTNGDWYFYTIGGRSYVSGSTGSYQEFPTTITGNVTFECLGQTGGTGAGATGNQSIDNVYLDHSTAIISTLISPSTNTTFLNETIVFNGNQSTNGQLSNATLYIWFSNSTIYSTTTNLITGTSNSTSFSASNFPYHNGYKWNIYACESNLGMCSWATNNYTFNVKKTYEINQTYSTPVVEGSTNNFILFINTSVSVSLANLIYDGTSYAGTLDISGSPMIRVDKTLVAPLVSGLTNKTFYWNVTLTDGTYFNTSATIQQVSDIGVDNCSTYTNLLLNYTLKDEETQSVLNLATDNATIEVDLDVYPSGSSTPILSFSRIYLNSSNARVCIDNNLSTSSYLMDVTAKYYSSDHNTEYNVIRSYVLNSTTLTQNIDLFDLKTASATTFEIVYKDSSFLPVKDAVIDIARQYVSEGVFKTIEKPITDTYGRTTASLIKNTGIYAIYVYKNGILLSTYSNVVPVCQNEITNECTITLNALSTIENPSDFQTIDNLYYTLTYNNSTKIVQTSFSTTDGSVSTINLTAVVYSAYLNETACSDQVTTSSGILTCTIPSNYYGNTTIVVTLYKDNEIIEQRSISLFPNPRDAFGFVGVIFFLILMLTLPLMFITSLVGMLAGSIIGMVFATLLLISSGGSAFSVSASLIWFFLVVALLFWKLNSKGDVS